jgi:hypothetical protein
MIDCISGDKSIYCFCYLFPNWLLKRPLATYLSYDRVKEVEDPADQLLSALESDYLAMLNKPGVLLYKLILKVGTIYSIIYNLSIENGLVKNVRVRILKLYCYIVRVELLYSIL